MSRAPKQEETSGTPEPTPAKAPSAKLAVPKLKTMVVPTQKRIGQVLLEMEKITQKQLNEALAIKKQKGGAIGAVLVDLGYCEKDDISAALAVQAGMRRVRLDELEIPPEVVEKMDGMTARSYSVVPIEFDAGILTVAMADPNNFRALDELHMLLGFDIRAAVADPSAVIRTLDKYLSLIHI